MIQISEQAARELRALLKESKAARGRAIRLTPDRKGGLAMTVAEPEVGDTIITFDDTPVLIVAASIAKALDGLTFDYNAREVDGQPHHSFTFRRPATPIAPD